LLNPFRGKKREQKRCLQVLQQVETTFLKLEFCHKTVFKVLQRFFWFVSFNSPKKRRGGFI
jgi:hypothetical protein